MINEDMIDKLKQRKAVLEAEMNRAAQSAANQAALPFQSAIGEIDMMLAMLQPTTPPTNDAPNK